MCDDKSHFEGIFLIPISVPAAMKNLVNPLSRRKKKQLKPNPKGVLKTAFRVRRKWNSLTFNTVKRIHIQE